MMVEMLVHQDRPLLRREPPKEAMRMPCTPLRPRRRKAVNQSAEPVSLPIEVPFIRHDEGLGCRGVSAHRLIVPKHHWLDHFPNDPPHEHPLWNAIPYRPLHSRRTMRHRLRYIHRAPLPLAAWFKLRNSILHLFRRRRLVEILHGRSFLHSCTDKQGRVETTDRANRLLATVWRSNWSRREVVPIADQILNIFDFIGQEIQLV